MNSDLPLVSFCLFTYNQEDFIEEAIKGALAQTYSRLEIIISDDCSTDGTYQKIIESIAHYTGPHMIRVNQNPQNMGLASHTNKLYYELAMGEFVAIAAGDDVSLPNRIEESVKFMLNNADVVALSTSLFAINNDGDIIDSYHNPSMSDQIFDIDFYVSDQSFHINGPSRILKKTVINAFPPLQNDCPTEDTTFLLRSFMFGKVALLADKLVKYRRHDNNITASKNFHKIDVAKIISQYKIDIHYATKRLITNELAEKLKIKIDQVAKIRQKEMSDKIRKNLLYRKIFQQAKKIFRYDNTINLWWWHDKDKSNYGDELSPYIISRLFDVKIHDCRGNGILLKMSDKIRFKLSRIHKGMKIPFQEKTPIYFAAGSIIENSRDNGVVWGSGIIHKHIDIKGGTFLAVRGYRTIDRLKELGYPYPNVVGDPALLLPIVYKPKVNLKKYKLGIIPHYVDYEDFVHLQNSDVLVINLVNAPSVEFITNQINSCEFTISSSLHGIIVSHAYNVPSLWYKFSDRLSGDDIKFSDYFSSVGIEDYKGFELDWSTFDLDQVIDNIANLATISTIQVNFDSLQKKLVQAAPFKVKFQYKYLLDE